LQWVTGARNRSPKPGVVSYDFVKEERRVNAYYFYVHDREFGPYADQRVMPRLRGRLLLDGCSHLALSA